MGTTACCCCQLSLGIPIPSSSSISRCKASKTAWWCLSRSRSCGQGSASLHSSSTPAHRSTLQDNQTWLNNKIHMSNIASLEMNLLERQRTKKSRAVWLADASSSSDSYVLLNFLFAGNYYVIPKNVTLAHYLVLPNHFETWLDCLACVMYGSVYLNYCLDSWIPWQPARLPHGLLPSWLRHRIAKWNHVPTLFLLWQHNQKDKLCTMWKPSGLFKFRNGLETLHDAGR